MNLLLGNRWPINLPFGVEFFKSGFGQNAKEGLVRIMQGKSSHNEKEPMGSGPAFLYAP